MHPESFLCLGDVAIAPEGRSSHLTSRLRRAGEERKQGRQQADSRSHLTAGFKMTKTHQNGSPRRICSVAPALFPLRELTGHIISSKNIRREWGRTRAGVGLRGGAHGRPSFASAVLNHRSPFRDSPCVFWTSRVSTFRIHYPPEQARAGSSCCRDAPIRFGCVRRALVCVRRASWWSGRPGCWAHVTPVKPSFAAVLTGLWEAAVSI